MERTRNFLLGAIRFICACAVAGALMALAFRYEAITDGLILIYCAAVFISGLAVTAALLWTEGRKEWECLKAEARERKLHDGR